MNEKTNFMMTTYDNPFSPFDEFIQWFKYDKKHNYDTCEVFASYANLSEVAGDGINDYIVNEAAKDMIRDYPMLYRKVYRSDYPNVGKVLRA